jgi:antitoxin component of MazEF toxin-antitoxin module
MIALKVEKIGGQAAVILTDEALAALHLSVGDTLQLEPSGDGAFSAVTREGWADDPHARGRAFLRRYNRSFSQL